MDIRTLCLDGIILAATAYPSGLSYSLFVAWRGPCRELSTDLLAVLALPFLIVTPAVWCARPDLLALRTPSMPLLALAVLTVPLAILLEYALLLAELYLRTGRLPQRVAIHRFWRRQLTPLEHLLLAVSAVGEEIFFRQIWISIMLSLALPLPLTAAVGAAAYGANHLAFGGTAVLTKGMTGLLYGALYLLGGQSILLPIISHVLQNMAMFRLIGIRRD